MEKKILLAYFSRADENYVSGNIVNLPVGNTEVLALKIQKLTGAALFKIDPVRDYPKNYTACTEQAQKELRDGARPELKQYLPDLEGYNTVVLAYPNWWGTMPMPVWTFLERYNFTGVTILPLCTNEGSGMGRSEADIRTLCPGAKLGKGLAVRGGSVSGTPAGQQVERWLKSELNK